MLSPHQDLRMEMLLIRAGDRSLRSASRCRVRISAPPESGTPSIGVRIQVWQPVEKRRILGKSDEWFRLANLEFLANEQWVRTNGSDDGALGLLIAVEKPRNRALAKRNH